MCTCLTDCLAHSGIQERIITTARTVASADMVARGSTPLPKLRPRVQGTGSACVPKQNCYREYVAAWAVTMTGNSLGHLIKGRPPTGPCAVSPLPSPSLYTSPQPFILKLTPTLNSMGVAHPIPPSPPPPPPAPPAHSHSTRQTPCKVSPLALTPAHTHPHRNPHLA